MTRATLARCVELFDRLRSRVGSEAAMERAVEFATDASKRVAIASLASGVDPAAVAVIDAVARTHGESLQSLRKRSRKTIAVRDEAVYVARAVAKLSFHDAARLLGRDDHSSFVTGQRRFEKRLAGDEVLAARVKRVVGGAAAGAAVAA